MSAAILDKCDFGPIPPAGSGPAAAVSTGAAFTLGYRGTGRRRCAGRPGLARALDVGTVLVKDESSRFDLSAFKILGASWGTFRALRAQAGALPPWRTVAELRRALTDLPAAGDLRLLTATAGNHGRALARVGRWFGMPTTVLVPAGTTPAVVNALRADGAQVRQVDGGYDDAVRAAADLAAEQPTYLLIQDTAWPGYELVPAWIVEGYQTIFWELDDQLTAAGLRADLLVVPVGVGSLMSAAIGYLRVPAPAPGPRLLGVEPTSAACALASLRSGRPVTVPTGATVIAGLNAGTLSSTAWPLLRAGLDAAVAVTEDEVVGAGSELAEAGVPVGACAAATLAGVTAAGTAAFGLTRSSTVVLLATEAGTPAGDRPRE